MLKVVAMLGGGIKQNLLLVTVCLSANICVDLCLGIAHCLHLVVSNGLGFWVRAKQNSSSTTLAMTSTINRDKIDSDEEVLTDDIQHVTQPSTANNSSNFIASSDQSLLLSNQYVNISNDDDIIVSETSINEEPNNLSIDIVDN